LAASVRERLLTFAVEAGRRRSLRPPFDLAESHGTTGRPRCEASKTRLSWFPSQVAWRQAPRICLLKSMPSGSAITKNYAELRVREDRIATLELRPSPDGPIPFPAGTRIGFVRASTWRRCQTRSRRMNEIARQLRAQIPSSTDPDWLERMAQEAESSDRRNGRRDGQSCSLPCDGMEHESSAASSAKSF